MLIITMEKVVVQCKNKEFTWKQGRPLISSSVTKRNLKEIENWFVYHLPITIFFLLEGGQSKNESKN